MPRRVRKGIRKGHAGLKPPTGATNRKKHLFKLFLTILDPALNKEVQLIQKFDLVDDTTSRVFMLILG